MQPDLWFDIYPYNNPKAGARLIRLTKNELLAGSFFRVERRGTGAGKVVLNSGQAAFTAANLHEENLVEVGDANVSATLPLGGFFLHRGDFKIISADGQGGEDFGIGGPGLLAYVARAVMLNASYRAGGHPPFDDIWRLHAQGPADGASSALGSMLRRVIEELTAAGRPIHECPDLVFDFTWTHDSTGAVWTPYAGEFIARVKQQILSVILELVGKGLDVQMREGRQLKLSAYNSYGRDRRGVAFGAAVTRFAHAANIANPAVRAIEAGLNASHALVGGSDVYELVASPVSSHVTRSVGLDSDAAESTALTVDAQANLRSRQAGADVPALRGLYGTDPLTGRYLYAPPELGGHAWVGDLCTIHRGSGPFQWNNADARIEAIQFDLVADKGWDDPLIEFGNVYRSPEERGRAAQILGVIGHPHPPNPRLCEDANAGVACSALTASMLAARTATNGDAENAAGTEWSGGAGYQTSRRHAGARSYGDLSGASHDISFAAPAADVYEAGVRYMAEFWGNQDVMSAEALFFGVVGDEATTWATGPTEVGVDGNTWGRIRMCWTPTANRTGVRIRITQTGAGLTVWDDVKLYRVLRGVTAQVVEPEDQDPGTSNRALRCDTRIPHGTGITNGGPFHGASAISVVDAANHYTGTDVEAILAELFDVFLQARNGGGDVLQLHGSMGATETFDPANGNWHVGTLDANCTITLTGPVSGRGCSIMLELVQDGTGGRTIALPATVVNEAALEAAQVTTAGSTSFLALWTRDGGTTWYGAWIGGGGDVTQAEFDDHSTRHETGGGDAIKLDDLAAPDDNTDLNASTAKHGLLPKLPGGTTTFLRADGAFAAPPGIAYEPLTNGDATTPELIFSDGDVVMVPM